MAVSTGFTVPALSKYATTYKIFTNGLLSSPEPSEASQET
jgi:hypothetical protein